MVYNIGLLRYRDQKIRVCRKDSITLIKNYKILRKIINLRQKNMDILFIGFQRTVVHFPPRNSSSLEIPFTVLV